jgi:hypothetical protein
MSETPDAARAFEQYYDLGDDRSLELLAERMYQDMTQNQTGTKQVPKIVAIVSQLKKWSTLHKWQSRVIERDRAKIEAVRKKRDAEIERMNEEHALLGRTQALRAVKQIEELIKTQKFGSQATVQLFKVSTDLERIARGAATERQELTGKDGEALGVGIYLPQKNNK